MAIRFDVNEPWDNLNGPSPPGVHWSTDNVGEAVPGVMSPLSASIWSVLGETCTRESFVAIGAFPPEQGKLPERLEDRVVRIFCGRVALQVELMTALGDRLPGTSGQEIAAALFGSVPDDIEFHPTRSRYPAIAWKLGRTFLGMPRRLERSRPSSTAGGAASPSRSTMPTCRAHGACWPRPWSASRRRCCCRPPRSSATPSSCTRR